MSPLRYVYIDSKYLDEIDPKVTRAVDFAMTNKLYAFRVQVLVSKSEAIFAQVFHEMKRRRNLLVYFIYSNE